MAKKNKNKNKKKGRKGTQIFPLMDLPTDIVLRILYRFPIDTIMKLKRVCSAMYKLISHPDFTLHYSKNSPFTALLAPTNPGFGDTYKNLELLQVVSDSYQIIRTPIKPCIPKDVKNFTFVGSCNGLVCFSVRSSETEVVYVCNPVVGQIRVLPERKIGRDTKYAFGFCSSSNDYKVLRLIRNNNQVPEIWKGSICTLKRVGILHRYRVLADATIPFTSTNSNNIIAHNGVFYWIVERDNSRWISAFDLSDEKVGRLSHPHGLVLNCFNMRLRSINNHLCLVIHSNHSEFVMWEMNVDGVEEEITWTKHMVPYMSFGDLKIFPEIILGNGDIFVCFCKGRLVVYDRIKKTYTETGIKCDRIASYAPSLLSLEKVVTGGHTINV